VRRNLLLGAAGLVTVIGLLAAIYVAFNPTSKTVHAEITAYTTKAPYKVTFEVDKPPADTVRCTIYAVDYNLMDVGHVDNIVVGPRPDRATRLSVIVPTTAAPTQFQVYDCDVVPAITPMP